MGSFTKEEIIEAIRELDRLATSRGSDAVVAAAIRELAQRFCPPGVHPSPSVEDVKVSTFVMYGHNCPHLADIVGGAPSDDDAICGSNYPEDGFRWRYADQLEVNYVGTARLEIKAPSRAHARWFADCLIAHAAGCPPHWVDMGFKAASLGDRWLYKQGKIVLVSAVKSAGGPWAVYDCTVFDVNAPVVGCLNEMEARLKAAEIVVVAS